MPKVVDAAHESISGELQAKGRRRERYTDIPTDTKLDAGPARPGHIQDCLYQQQHCGH